MLGAICGDIIGSRHEHRPIKTTAFELLHPRCRWTDDTVCTVAVAEALLDAADVGASLAAWARRYPDAGYGPHFVRWAFDDPRRPYGSWGNGSAMRVSPAGWLSTDLADAASLGAMTAAPSHDHQHGLRGAKAVAVATRMALEGWDREQIRAVVTDRFGYDLARSPDAIRSSYAFDVSCQGSVPEALVCALAATSFEEAVRLAVSLGGDADTQAAIAGSVAEGLFGVPEWIVAEVLGRLDPALRDVHNRFRDQVARSNRPRSDPDRISRDLATGDA
jgi:ADP-ribosylglycohydrolase